MGLGTTFATVGVAEAEVVPENLGRRFLQLVNTSAGTISLSLIPIGGGALPAAVADSGTVLAAGAAMTIERAKVNDRIHVGAVRAIGSGAGLNLAITELDEGE